MSDPKKKKPIVVKDKNDPRYKAYKDSLSDYKWSQTELKKVLNTGKTSNGNIIDTKTRQKETPNKVLAERIARYKKLGINDPNLIKQDMYDTDPINKGTGKKNRAISYESFNYPNQSSNDGEYNLAQYKKPTQEVQISPNLNIKKSITNIPQENTVPRDRVKPLDLDLTPIGLKMGNTTPEANPNVVIKQRTAKNFKVTDEIIQPFGGSRTDYTINGPEDLIRNELGPGNKRTITPQYAMGGTLNTNNTNNMLNEFNEGGSHESNPLGGIPQGNGNTVEQGETRKGDFIYSDRIILTSDIIKEFNLPKSLSNKTVADASKLLNNKFKDRDDSISNSTKSKLLDRIAQAQEVIKAKQDMLSQAKETNSTEVPDMMNGQIPEGFESTNIPQKQMFLGGDLPSSEIFGMLGNFGSKKSEGNSEEDLGMSALKMGVSTGANMLLPGAGAFTDPLVDITANLIGGNKKENKAIREGYMMGMKGNNNHFRNGGDLNPIEDEPYGDLINKYPNRNPKLGQTGLVSLSENDLLERNGYSNPEIAPLTSSTNNNLFSKDNLSKLGDTLGQAARYAPIAMNAYQLSQLKRPQHQRLNRLDQRFKPEYVDEKIGQNLVNNEMNNTIGAITQMGGSEGSMRNSIIAAGLNKTKALGDVYSNAASQNRVTNVQGQQFNAGIDQTNLNQANQELDINDRNSAAYRNEKSKYLAEIGNGIGDIGKEEIYKKIAVTTTGYNFLGKFMKENPNATPEQALEAAKKEGIVVDNNTTTGTTSKALGGYLFKNKRK